MPRDDLAQTQSQLGRLKRWKLKLDRLQPLEVQVENSFIKFFNSEFGASTQNLMYMFLAHVTRLARAGQCQDSFELGASLKLGASLEQKLEQD